MISLSEPLVVITSTKSSCFMASLFSIVFMTSTLAGRFDDSHVDKLFSRYPCDLFTLIGCFDGTLSGVLMESTLPSCFYDVGVGKLFS